MGKRYRRRSLFLMLLTLPLIHSVTTTSALEATPTSLPGSPAPLDLSSVHVGRLTTDEITALFTQLPSTIGDERQYAMSLPYHSENPEVITVEFQPEFPGVQPLRLSAANITDPSFRPPCGNAALCVEDEAINHSKAVGMSLYTVEAGWDGDLVWLVRSADVGSDVIVPTPTPIPSPVFRYEIFFGWYGSPWMFVMSSADRAAGDALIAAFVSSARSAQSGSPTST